MVFRVDRSKSPGLKRSKLVKRRAQRSKSKSAKRGGIRS